MRLRENQIGDTIIEVLLAVGIVGLAVAGGYGIANRSLRQARQAQERGEALKLAEGQVEAIKAYAADDGATDTAALFSQDTYCVNLSNSTELTPITFTDAGRDLPELDADTLGDYPDPECKEGLYHVALESESQGSSSSDKVEIYEFTVSVRWFSLGGSDKEQVQINYRTFVKK